MGHRLRRGVPGIDGDSQEPVCEVKSGREGFTDPELVGCDSFQHRAGGIFLDFASQNVVRKCHSGRTASQAAPFAEDNRQELEMG